MAWCSTHVRFPNSVGDLEHIQPLTPKNVAWKWNNECDKALKMAKRKMTAALILAYFDYGQDLSQDSI